MIFCSTKNDTEVFITGESSESDFYVYDTPAKTEISFDTCFDASDIQYWMNFGIFTHGLIISIPKNNELTLTGKTEIDTYHIVKNGCQHIQKGVLISPSLNGLNSSLFENEVLYNSTLVQNNTMNFTVNMLSGNETVELFYSGNSTFNIYPNYNYINLSDDNPYYLALLSEIPVNNGTIVCGLPDDVDIHVTDGTYDSLCLYDSMDLENNVEFPTSFSSISSKSGCFHLYRASNNTPPITALIRSISIQSKDCENTNNVFQSTEAPKDLSATSKGNGSCEVIILASKYTPFTTISINTIGEIQSDSLILKSTINSKQIVEIPAQDAKYWMNFGIHSYALTAIIPQDSTVSINTNVQRNGYNIQKGACQYIQKGVIVSPGYTGMKYSDFVEVLYKSEFFQSTNMEFNAIEVSEKDEVTIRYDQTFIQFWQSNGTFSINAQKNFSVQVFKNSNVTTSDFLIEYTLTSNINLNSNNIDLNENETYYLGLLDDIPINNSIVVCAGAQNTELFITNGKYDSFCLYDSPALENNIQ
uniref:IgGFc-binding protein N-terminal domain-containing protein n=1 Tax=Panagrolaimus davidi TaxID=227884 RepID=A0A914Q7C6_9BILA